MNSKLKEIASTVMAESDIQQKMNDAMYYEFFLEFTEKYGTAVINECIDAVTKAGHPNAFGEIVGVNAINERFKNVS